MAGRIRQEDIEAVRERTDIVKLVSQYLTLKKAGGDNMTGLCPFHQEKTPSFSVSPGKQVFFCHGCGKGGDAIGFLRELEHLGFAEAHPGLKPFDPSGAGNLTKPSLGLVGAPAAERSYARLN